MSIRTKILLPLLAFLALGAIVSVFIGMRSLASHAELASLSGKAIDASDASREARDQFDKAEQLTSQVLAMTDFVDNVQIETRFKAASSATAVQLSNLKTAALSADMGDLAQKGIDQFTRWKSDAEVLLGLRTADEIATTDVMNRRGQAIRDILDKAVSMAGRDARTRIADAGSRMRSELLTVFGSALAVALAGVVGAFWVAGNLVKPVQGLVKNAKRLAAGDVSVELGALRRKDEIGEIARAVEMFRDNVKAQMRSVADATEQRRLAGKDRERHEEARVAATAEQNIVMSAVAGALTKLAAGDLTCRVANVPAAYKQLEADFNAAVAQLTEAMRAIAHSSHNMQQGSGEVSVAADNLARRTEQQAASLEETAAGLDQITATVNKTAEGAKHARAIVSTAKLNAETSGLVVNKAVEAMNGIEKSSKEISQIVGVIDAIAFQTNLLALNAGVEAARAGEAGRGFAVVASEVRALAQRSADAAKQIKVLISTSTQQVDQGVDLVAETGQALARIAGQVADINVVVSDIAASAQEQASGLHQINMAINNMDQVTQQNAAMVEETTAAAHSLTRETEELNRLMQRFQIETDATRSPIASKTKRRHTM